MATAAKVAQLDAVAEAVAAARTSSSRTRDGLWRMQAKGAEGAGGDGEDGGGAIRDGCGEAASAGGCRAWCAAAGDDVGEAS